jgi:hypothetical protein
LESRMLIPEAVGSKSENALSFITDFIPGIRIVFK